MVKENKVMMFSSVHVWNDTRIFYKEALSLAKAGFEVDFFAIDNGMQLQTYPGINIHVLPESKSKLSRVFRWRRLYKAAKQSDAKYYHIHDPELLILFPKLKKVKPMGSKFIYDMHENFPKDIETKSWIPAFLRKPLKKLVLGMEKYTMSYCDHIILAEASYRDDYVHLEERRVTSVYNFPVYVERIGKKIGIKPFTLIYVGSITAERGIWEMLKLMNALENGSPSKYRLELLGPITKSLQMEIKEYLKKCNLEKVVTLYGRVPYPEIWKAYSTADLGLCLLHDIPNHRNSMATKLYEYMAASLPILATNLPDWESFIEKHQCGETSSPFNIKKLVNIVEKRAENREKYLQEGLNGRHAYEMNYNWEMEAKKLLVNVYQYKEMEN
ncbi:MULTISPECIES: glycosyltransferase family 4 protein [Listeria]|uniref:glycosyltransferase family 4 protein n=1 Tax=Listeria TaxID=1637 RepID=UPI000B5908C7|nr:MULTISPECIES: glycosyltransferase family 4 protein [Listeria]